MAKKLVRANFTQGLFEVQTTNFFFSIPISRYTITQNAPVRREQFPQFPVHCSQSKIRWRFSQMPPGSGSMGGGRRILHHTLNTSRSSVSLCRISLGQNGVPPSSMLATSFPMAITHCLCHLIRFTSDGFLRRFIRFSAAPQRRLPSGYTRVGTR